MSHAEVRITVTGDGPWQAVTSIPGGDDVTRTIDVIRDGAIVYPAAPPPALAADAITGTVAALTAGTAVAADVEDLGKHLFAALLGPLWATIEARLGAAPPDLLELALDLDGAATLRGLPWELMVGADGWLAKKVSVGGRFTVAAVTRRTKPGTARTPALVHPLRYLFVIGTSIGDEIRAGAECLGLMRQVGAEVQDRVVERLALTELAAVMAEFDPHVVHVICHGRLNPASGSVVLELWDAKGPVKVSGDMLAKTLVWTDPAGARRAPALVILSACSSGDRMVADRGTGIARALVSEGVPMVIAMGAAIHDQACRLFTLELGQALVRRTPLIAAASYGRSAALQSRTLPPDRFDWGLIQIVLDRDQRGDVAVQAATDQSHEQRVIEWLNRSGLEINLPASEPTYPSLCAAEDALRAFYKLLAGQKAGLIVLAQPPGKDVKLGRRRLISELAAIAIRAGHVPVLVMDRWDHPRGPVELVHQLDGALKEAWRRHALAEPATTAVGELAAVPASHASAAPADLAQAAWISAGALADALRRDCDALRAAMLAQHGGGQVVLFFHDLHEYGDAIPLVLKFLTSRGKALLEIAPVVVSWKQSVTADKALIELPQATKRAELLKRTLEQGMSYLEPVYLAPLAPKTVATIPLAARLALQRVLLYPHRAQPACARQRWLLDVSAGNVASVAALNYLARAAEGCCPGQFGDEDFWSDVERAIQVDGMMPTPHALTEADDEAVLAAGGRR